MKIIMKRILIESLPALTLALAASLCPIAASAKLNVVTTLPSLSAVVTEVGGSDVDATAIAKGTQDPHFIEAKPSYMTKIAKADLVVVVGLELEIGYIPPLLQGARNPKVMPGSRGYLEVGSLIHPLELPTGKITRADGDVHPDGNPHVMLDPVRVGEIAIKIAERMGQLDASHAGVFMDRAKSLQLRLNGKTKEWQARVTASGVRKAVSYHKTLTYFFDRFKIENPAILEPKPGVPPTAPHILEVIQTIKEQKIPLILVENYFDSTVTNRIKEAIPSIRVVSVPVEVNGSPGVDSIDSLFEKLVSAVEGK